MQSRSRSSLRRPLIWLGIILLIALVVGGGYWFLNPSGTHPPALATVTRGDLKAMVNANARVRSQRSVKLAFPFSGLVTKVNILEGDTVKAGDVIAEMDNRDAQRRVAQAEANLAARQQDLAEAQQPPSATELEIAQQTLKKAALALAAAQDQFKKDGSEENRVAQEIAQSDYDIARAN
ncbi:MAG TPA: biotin/lipoyl-binding protein, partial [Anaerolineae bacterium]|nr:biotin/lipoyl-binding protein [Anaerolineae bacterium]